MPDALPKSITMPGGGMLIKVKLAPACSTHPGISVDSVVLAQKELRGAYGCWPATSLHVRAESFQLSEDLEGVLAVSQHFCTSDMQDRD